MGKRRIGSFKDRHFTSEVILWALRWYLAFPISYRDFASLLSDGGVEVDHTTLFHWVQVYAPTLEGRIRRRPRPLPLGSTDEFAYLDTAQKLEIVKIVKAARG